MAADFSIYFGVFCASAGQPLPLLRLGLSCERDSPVFIDLQIDLFIEGSERYHPCRTKELLLVTLFQGHGLHMKPERLVSLSGDKHQKTGF